MKCNHVELPPEFEEHRERLKEIQRCQLESLKLVSAECEKFGLRYYLASGTALGAARHGGFIPWDDDIDIVLPRPDFDKLEELIFSGKTGLKAYSWTRTPEFFKPALKTGPATVENLDHSPYALDVFPLDILPRFRFVRWLQEIARLVLMQAMIARSGCMIDQLSKSRVCIMRVISWFLPRDPLKVNAMICRMMDQKKDFTEQSIVGGRFSIYGEREFMPFDVYGVSGGKDVEFEGLKFKAPLHLPTYLKNFFGDWESLPPLEKRLPKHTEDGPWFWRKDT